MKQTGAINYVELPARDLGSTKRFFVEAFGWSFVDYGPDYSAFESGLSGGFYRADKQADADAGSALVVLYSLELEKTMARVEQAGGVIKKPIFTFPGGRRFHFVEPSGNEFAVWSDVAA